MRQSGHHTVDRTVNTPPRRRNAIALVLIALITLPLAAQSVRNLTLSEMTAQAGAIFIGTVTNVEGGRDSDGEIVTWTTFRVDQPIRGTVVGEQRRIKQSGGTADGMAMQVEHMRYFREGEQVLVMFYPESRLGFTSPVGLSQGVFPLMQGGMVSGITPSSLEGMEGDLLGRYNLANGPPEQYPVDRFVRLLSELATGTK